MQNVNFKYADIGTMIYFHGVIIKLHSDVKLYLPNEFMGNLKNAPEACNDYVFNNVILA